MSDIEKMAEEYAQREDMEVGLYSGLKMAFLAGAEAARPQWIKCSERLPEEKETVLTYSADGIRLAHWKGPYEWEVKNGLLDSKHWISDCRDSCGCCDSWNDKITHWMPELEPPEDE